MTAFAIVRSGSSRALASLALAALGAGTAAGAACAREAWETPGLLPEAVYNPGNLTASKWIWHQGPVKRLGEAFYRLTFTVDAAVTSLPVRVAANDSGEWYVNGQRMAADACDIGPALKVGRNVLAAHVKNYERAGGLLAFGQGRDADGKALAIRSGPSFRAAATAPDGWTSEAFDDSGWRPARVLADASGQPFSNDRDYLADFATPDERRAVAAHVAARAPVLPQGLDGEPEPVARVVYDGHLPKVSVNGYLHEPDLNANGVNDDYSCSVLKKAASLGFRFHQLGISPASYEKAPGVYDFSKLDELAGRTLALCPEAYLFLVINVSIPKWCAAHPEAQVGYADGKAGEGGGDELSGRVVRPSAASREYRAEVGRLIAAFGAHVRSRPWGRRVVATRPCWGIYWEWHVYGMYHSPDVGPAMTEAFHRWKGGAYAGQPLPSVADRTHGACCWTRRGTGRRSPSTNVSSRRSPISSSRRHAR